MFRDLSVTFRFILFLIFVKIFYNSHSQGRDGVA